VEVLRHTSLANERHFMTSSIFTTKYTGKRNVVLDCILVCINGDINQKTQRWSQHGNWTRVRCFVLPRMQSQAGCKPAHPFACISNSGWCYWVRVCAFKKEVLGI